MAPSVVGMMARLVVESGPDAGREYPLGDVSVIGRLKTAQVALTDQNASREHTRILHQGEGWFLVDLGSRNGTQVNGKGVQRHKLAQGDRIAVGKTVLRFEGAGGPSAGAGGPSAGAGGTSGDGEKTSVPTEPLPLTHPNAEQPKVEEAKKPEKTVLAPAPAGPATRALVTQTKSLAKRPADAAKAPLAVSGGRAVDLSGATQALLVAGAVVVAALVLFATWWMGTKLFEKVIVKPKPTSTQRK